MWLTTSGTRFVTAIVFLPSHFFVNIPPNFTVNTCYMSSVFFFVPARVRNHCHKSDILCRKSEFDTQ